MPLRPPPAMPAEPGPRKRRWRIYVPFGVGVALLLTAAAAWWAVRGRVASALDGAEAGARAAGVELTVRDRRIGGFPLRLRVSFGPVRAATPSGWAVQAPSLVAQAYIYAPLHWVLIAPDGLTVTRPEGGAVRITGRALRASVVATAASPWRVTLVGDDLDFAVPPGARPFSLQSAVRLGLYLKPAPGGAPGDGAVLLDVAHARATPGSLAWNLAPDAAVDAAVEGRLTHLAAFAGADWGAAVRRWRDAGGALELGRVEALGGATELSARGGRVAVGPDGRLAGEIPLRLRQAPRLISGPAGAQVIAIQPLDPAGRGRAGSQFDLRLEGGAVRLGPVPVGPSPKVG